MGGNLQALLLNTEAQPWPPWAASHVIFNSILLSVHFTVCHHMPLCLAQFLYALFTVLVPVPSPHFPPYWNPCLTQGAGLSWDCSSFVMPPPPSLMVPDGPIARCQQLLLPEEWQCHGKSSLPLYHWLPSISSSLQNVYSIKSKIYLRHPPKWGIRMNFLSH